MFFSFPHIAIDSEGKIGSVARPNREASSSACGALIAVTGQLKAEGLEYATKAPGVHDPLEPEYSILKQRIARRMAYEKIDPSKSTLVDVTKVAERVITNVRLGGAVGCGGQGGGRRGTGSRCAG